MNGLTTPADAEFAAEAQRLGESARRAARAMAGLRDGVKSEAIRQAAAALRAGRDELIDANARDVSAAEAAGLDRPLVERLRLDAKRVESMASGVERVAEQVDPVGQTIEATVRPNGLRVEKRRVPIGVVLFFYESRPNVTADAAALCVKSGNAVILRGGKEAIHSNGAIARVVAGAFAHAGVPAEAVQLVGATDRALVPHLLKQRETIDLVIPRGGRSLIEAVVRDATIPVLKHFDGNCHIYLDGHLAGMEARAIDVCVNAKTSYPGGAVCNAVEHLLVHRAVAPALLGRLCELLAGRGVEVRGDDAVCRAFPRAIAATDSDWDTEYLAPVIGIRVVDSLDEAIEHINRHGSRHTDAILTTDVASAERFVREVDSASVMVNASTRFADGGEYGLGAEIGISTDKLHARGPMGAADLTTYKWVVTGDGHCR
jgi:glutamate-5-semialdehyde dehydrogenase